MKYQRKSFIEESQEATIDHVISHISSCCSPTDDPAEFAGEIQISVEVLEDGSRVVTGVLEGHEPYAAYLGFAEYPNVPRNQSSIVGRETDLTPAELQKHLKQKFGVGE